MSKKLNNGQPGEMAIAKLPPPCPSCEASGGNWAHVIRHHEFAGESKAYEMAGRCSCQRGQMLAAADRDRAEGRKPAGMEAQDEATGAKMARWRREQQADNKRIRELFQTTGQVDEVGVPVDASFESTVMKPPRLQDLRDAEEFERRLRSEPGA